MFIPYRVYVPTDRQPFVNAGLILLIVAISGIALTSDGLGMYEDLAGIDVAAARAGRAQLADDRLPLPVLAVTSALLHGGWLHLAGNLLFLWVFGNAIEYKFRHVGHLALFGVVAMAAGLTHYAFDSSPFVGASGAVTGIMGAFLVFFPRNDVDSVLVIFYVVRRITVSSFWIILSYVAWDVISIMLGWQPGVALGAHLGGFVAGFGIAFTCAYMGWLIPEDDEQTLLQVLNIKGRCKKEFIQY